MKPGPKSGSASSFSAVGSRTPGIAGNAAAQVGEADERAVLDARVVARRRRDAAIRPLVERDEQCAQRRRPAVALRRDLAHARLPRRIEQSGHAHVVEARREVEPHVVGRRNRPSLPVVDVERGVHLPELVGRVHLEDERIGRRPLENAVPDAGDRVAVVTAKVSGGYEYDSESCHMSCRE